MNGWVCIDKTVLLTGYSVSKYGCNISFSSRWWIYTCLWKATLSKLGRGMEFKSCVKSSMCSELANKTLQLFTKMVFLTNILYPWKYSDFLVLLLYPIHGLQLITQKFQKSDTGIFILSTRGFLSAHFWDESIFTGTESVPGNKCCSFQVTVNTHLTGS